MLLFSYDIILDLIISMDLPAASLRPLVVEKLHIRDCVIEGDLVFDPEVFANVNNLEILSELFSLVFPVDTSVRRIIFHTKALPKLKTIQIDSIL